MMFKNHTMSLVTDLNILGPSLMDVNSILVAAITTNEVPKAENIYIASILMPTTDMLMRWADGQPLVLQNEYPAYLSSIEPDSMLVVIIASLLKRNVVLYIPEEENKIFGGLLLQHLYYMYGIVCNTPYTQFAFDINKKPFILSKFYMMNLMDAELYLQEYPATYPLPDWVINKLAVDINPYPAGATFETYRTYFNELNRSKAQPQQKQQMIRFIN